VKENPSITKLPSISALPVGVALQEFEITGVLGEGGFGIVYLARDRLLGREVAIKEYMPASLAARGNDRGVVVRSRSHEQTFAAGLQSFISEARLLAQFKHPALVEIFRFWEQNGTAYMAMPFYRGKTLKQFLKEHRDEVNEDWLRRLLMPLLDGLQHLHAANCFHRDIAPDNILILGNGQPLLLDFGAARRIVGDVTSGLTVILKPGYAPVEQYADDASVAQGPWTDIYGLAAICHYAITGTVPPASVTRLMRDPMVPLVAQGIPGYSKRLLLAIDRGLAVKPEQRPQSLQEFRKLLEGDAAASTELTQRSTPVFSEAAPVASAAPSSSSNFPPAVSESADSDSPSKRFPFLKPVESKQAPRVTAELPPSNASTTAAPISTPPRAKKTAKKSSKTPVESMVSLSEDTVILGSLPRPAIAPESDAALQEDANRDTSASGSKRSRLPWVALFVALPVIALVIWYFASGAQTTETAASNASTTQRDDGSRTASGGAKSDAPKITPEPPSPSANVDSKQVSGSMSDASSKNSEQLAALEKARVEEQARRDAEQLLVDEKLKAEEKAKADEKEKARLAASGTVVLNIVPWGEVFVNGQPRGVSPPRKRISLLEGTYQITVKNSSFEPYVASIEVKRGQDFVVAHQFK
jgi:serine/threonine protein kinase